GQAFINIDDCNSPFISTPCAAGVACNTFDGNLAEDSANHATAGAVIFARDTGVFFANRFSIRSNSGGHAIHGIRDDEQLGECLVADNTFSGEIARLEGGGDFFVNNCTIAGNTVSGSAIYTENTINLVNSIIDQPAVQTLVVSGTPQISGEYL